MLDQKGLARLRPSDNTVSAIKSAIIVARAEREAAQQHLAERQTNHHQHTILNGSITAIRTGEEAVRDAEIQLIRLGALISGLERELAEAIAREAGEARAQQVRDATEAIDAFNIWFVQHYADHAAALAQGLALESRANALRESLPDPRTKRMMADLPAMKAAQVDAETRSLGFLVRLPAAERGAPPFWWPQ